MKYKMAENSLFAILLRSPWWISFAIVATFALASRAFLPEPYVALGMMGGLPFLVIGVIRAWRQWHAPNPARLQAALARAGEMNWRDFSVELEQAYSVRGYVVTRLNSPAADFQLDKDGAITLVSCKRWKAANHGVEALRDLAFEQRARGAQHAVYVCLAHVSDKARLYAKEEGIQVMAQAELAQLLLDES